MYPKLIDWALRYKISQYTLDFVSELSEQEVFVCFLHSVRENHSIPNGLNIESAFTEAHYDDNIIKYKWFISRYLPQLFPSDRLRGCIPFVIVPSYLNRANFFGLLFRSPRHRSPQNLPKERVCGVFLTI